MRRRSGLRVKLLAASVLVAVCSVAATAWVVSTLTSGAIQQQRGQALAEDTRVYDTLLAFAARNRGWTGVDKIVADLAVTTGRKITLTTHDRRPIAASAPGTPPATPSAVVDPLAVDTALLPSVGADRIDPRATGPFTLTKAELATLRGSAQRRVACLRQGGFDAKAVTGPSGRPAVELKGTAPVEDVCAQKALDRPTRTETRALRRLGALVNACLERDRLAPVTLKLDLTWAWTRPAVASSVVPQIINGCIDTSRRELLRPHVAPAAWLFIESPATAPALNLSPANTARIAAVAAAILVLTAGISFLLATRVVRPLRALTAAAHRMRVDGAAKVEVSSGGEIGDLAAAFNEMAEHRLRLEALRKDLVSDVAHELRTPLSNIRGWLEAAEDGIAPVDTARLLKESLLLQHIVDDLQDLSVADAGKLRLHPEPFGLRDLLGQVAAAHPAPGLVVTVSAPDLTVEADPVRLRQAVGNLVGNAIRHTPPGGRITLTARRTLQDVTIEVADTGIGIAPEDLPHVFDRFWRADRSRSRTSGGSGLGLAIVRSIAAAHGGTVAVASTPGQGTRFTLTFRTGTGPPPPTPDRSRRPRRDRLPPS
ncbi:sensor histidine kinase [Nonomuraea typhae]|uniref:sensor histidine kinase n=1 Tax=Nonomuraea typhae TaxID=2603600 RepID=UPI0012F9A953|nr:HAMP domain-containing sensor histidine kinase [Nonomuraea typhae]